MCGFTCIINHKDNLSQKYGEEFIRNSLKLIEYRGPDSIGIKFKGKFSAAMSQLKTRGEIMDVPVQIGDEIFAYNGEVFGDFKEGTPIPDSMISELKAFSNSKKIDGMYSVVRWQGSNNQAHILRDRFGILPFYYKETNEQLVLGSDLGVFLNDEKCAPNLQSLYESMVLGNTINNETVYKGINKIPPGTNTFLTDNLIKFKGQQHEIDPSADSSIQEALIDSVKRCSYTNENLGVTISGGLDSSILFHLLNSQGSCLKSYSIINGEDGVRNNDSIAREASNLPPHFSIEFDNSRFLSDMDKLMDIYKEPLMLSSSFLVYQLSELISKNDTRVILSGEGADELFFGYNSYHDFHNQKKNKDVAIKDFYFSEYKTYWYERILCKKNLDRMKSSFMDDLSSQKYEKWENKFRHAELKYSLEPLLKRNDLIYMHFGIESRAPFLHSIVPNFALQSSFESSREKQQLHELYYKLTGRRINKKKKPLRLSIRMGDPTSRFMIDYIKAHIQALEELGFSSNGILQYIDQNSHDNLYLLVKLYSTLLWKKTYIN